MRIAIGNDHAATDLKFEIMEYVKELGHEVVNFGTDTKESCHYPEIGARVGHAAVIKFNNIINVFIVSYFKFICYKCLFVCVISVYNCNKFISKVCF